MLISELKMHHPAPGHFEGCVTTLLEKGDKFSLCNAACIYAMSKKYNLVDVYYIQSALMGCLYALANVTRIYSDLFVHGHRPAVCAVEWAHRTAEHPLYHTIRGEMRLSVEQVLNMHEADWVASKDLDPDSESRSRTSTRIFG